MYPLCNAPLWSIVTLVSWRRKFGIPSRVASLLVDSEGEASFRTAWMRLSYYFSTIVLDSSRIIYRGDSWGSDEMETLFYCAVDGDVAQFRIVETGIGMFLMVPQASASSCWMDTWVPGGKGSLMGLVLFFSKPQVRPLSKWREFGKLVIGSIDSFSRKTGGP